MFLRRKKKKLFTACLPDTDTTGAYFSRHRRKLEFADVYVRRAVAAAAAAVSVPAEDERVIK